VSSGADTGVRLDQDSGLWGRGRHYRSIQGKTREFETMWQTSGASRTPVCKLAPLLLLKTMRDSARRTGLTLMPEREVIQCARSHE